VARPDARGHDHPKRCRFLASQTEEKRMEQQSVRKTFKYKLLPTPEQERTLATASIDPHGCQIAKLPEAACTGP
jgi:hypothetical protein